MCDRPAPVSALCPRVETSPVAVVVLALACLNKNNNNNNNNNVTRRDSRVVPNEVRRSWTEQVTRLNSKTIMANRILDYIAYKTEETSRILNTIKGKSTGGKKGLQQAIKSPR